MQYLGGKTRIAEAIAEQINRVRKPGQWVWEPFCGGLSVSVALSKAGPVWATDANPALIALYQAVQNGWQPPTELSREAYAAAKLLPDSDPLKAFAGFGCSFRAKWFGGYDAKDEVVSYQKKNEPRRTMNRAPAKSSRASLLKDVPRLQLFSCLDFLSVEPRETQALLYCDPPYAGTTGYDALPPFDSQRFLLRACEWARFTDVFVSEYSFPVGTCVWQRAAPGSSSLTKPGTIERLYHLPKGSRF